jgi:hypothetical protein
MKDGKAFAELHKVSGNEWAYYLPEYNLEIDNKMDNCVKTFAEDSDSIFIDDAQLLAASFIKGWDYAQNGADWVNTFPICRQSHQSPINLIDPKSKYGQSYNIYSFVGDEF